MRTSLKTRSFTIATFTIAMCLAGAMPVMAAKPTSPTNLTATAVSASQINLAWTDNSTNETGFKIERSINGTNFSQIATVGVNVNTYSNTSGLSQNTLYYYRVRAYNGSGNSTYTNIASATTLKTVPVAPTGLSATAISASQINLAWTDNATNEDGYSIERGTNGIDFSQIATVAAGVASYSNSSGLSENTNYYYRVQAYNNGGNSSYSNSASAITLKTIPSDPTSLITTAISSSQIDLVWTDNATNEDGYKIERGTTTMNMVQIDTISASATAYSATGLSANATYYFRVRAYNNGGNSGYSNISSSQTLPTAPNAPSNLTLTEITSARINLLWNDNSTNETGFSIERSLDGTNYTVLGTVSANQRYYYDTTVTLGDTYYYRVRAFNGASFSGYSGVASLLTYLNPPLEPSNLNGQAYTASGTPLIYMYWTDNSNNESNFKIERSDNSPDNFVEVGSSSSNYYLDYDIVVGDTYYYRVRANNIDGYSDYSAAFFISTL